MASKQAVSRLRKELKAIMNDPPPHIHVYCDESNILAWSYLLEGPQETPYEGGWYWGRLKFPKDYPFAPPSILMVTPNGRFEVNTRLCLSMSDYHPESWQPAWSLATVLKGLLSFMCEECPTAGAVDPPMTEPQRRRLAVESLAWNKANADFAKCFPEFDNILAAAASARGDRAQASQPPVTLPAAGEASRAQASAEPETSPSDVIGGARVRLHGLKARQDLNGQEGVVEESSSGDGTVAAGRVRIRTADGEIVGVRPENLEWLGGAAGITPPAVFEQVDD